MQPPAVILLDALGTLVALEPPAPLLREQLAERFDLRISEAEAARAIAAEIAYYRAHLDEGREPESLASLRRSCAKALRSALPARGGVSELELDALTEALMASLRFTPYPDVRPALTAARRRGARMVVVSNWDISLEAVLRRLALAPLLDGILTSAGAGARKPDPAIFRQALRLARAHPDEAIHVGDSLEEDVAGARNAGIEPILLCRDGVPAPSGVRTITTLADLA